MSTTGLTCGVAGWSGPLPGDPDNNSILSATPAYGGIDVSWTYPITNPAAVAHVLLYRSTSATFNTAVQLAVVAGNFYYDKSTVVTSTRYYYWIQIVSVKGTVGDTIGPASAIAKPTIEDLIGQLTGKIESDQLSTSLKTEIGTINTVGNNLLKEVNDRIASNTALSRSIAEVQSGLAQSMTYISTEITNRSNGDSALVSELNTMAAAVDKNTTAIFDEKTVRAAADSAMASNITQLFTDTDKLQTAITTEQNIRSAADTSAATQIDALFVKSDAATAVISNIETGKIGYSALRGTSVPFDGDGVTVIYPLDVYPVDTFPAYAVDRKKIMDATGVTRWNLTPAGVAKPLTWIAGLPLASAVKLVGVTGPNGESVTLEQSFLAQQDLNNNYKAQYTTKVQVMQDGTKIIGGFGIYGDATGIEAGFDVDKFWVGRSTVDAVTGKVTKVKPFIIDNGVVYINDAAINKLTVSKLRSEDNSLAFQNGKLRADLLEVNQITRGAYSGYSWPAAGQTGFYLGPGGLLMGNYNNLPGQPKKYIQITEDGNMYSPGFSLENGILSISQLNVIGTSNIQNNAVTIPVGAKNASTLTWVFSTPDYGLFLSIDTGGAPLFIQMGIVANVTHGGLSGVTNLVAELYLNNVLQVSRTIGRAYDGAEDRVKFSMPFYTANPGTGNISLELRIRRVTSGGGTIVINAGDAVMFAIGTKR